MTEYIPAVIHAMFWIGVGAFGKSSCLLIIKLSRKLIGWLRGNMYDDELLPSWKSINEALDTSKDGKK